MDKCKSRLLSIVVDVGLTEREAYWHFVGGQLRIYDKDRWVLPKTWKRVKEHMLFDPRSVGYVGYEEVEEVEAFSYTKGSEEDRAECQCMFELGHVRIKAGYFWVPAPSWESVELHMGIGYKKHILSGGESVEVLSSVGYVLPEVSNV